MGLRGAPPRRPRSEVKAGESGSGRERMAVRRLSYLTAALPILVWALVSVGCGAPKSPLEPKGPLDMSTLDPAQDHWRIATAYTHEATTMRQKAEELFKQAAHYERLFGSDSEWVTGTRLLAQFYEEAARERERLAEVHVGLAGGHRSVQYTGLDSR